jgi:zinc-finger-containing domain
MNDRTKFILKGQICPYCGSEPIKVDATAIYGENTAIQGKFFICAPCDAYVGTHKNSGKPLGRLANKELRFYKQQAHLYFDKIWRGKSAILSRTQAYKMLCEKLGTPKKYTHIGMFKTETCKRVIEICKQFLDENIIKKL